MSPRFRALCAIAFLWTVQCARADSSTAAAILPLEPGADAIAQLTWTVTETSVTLKQMAIGAVPIVRLPYHYDRPDWKLSKDRRELPAQGDLEALIRGEDTIVELTATGPAGEIQHEQRIVHFGDWKTYEATLDVPEVAGHEWRFALGVVRNDLNDGFQGVSTSTSDEILFPQLSAEYLQWKSKLIDSPSWGYGAFANVAYAWPASSANGPVSLPLSWTLGGRISRRNFAVWGRRVHFTPWISLLAQSWSQAGSAGSVAVDSGFTQSQQTLYLARTTLALWAEIGGTLAWSWNRITWLVSPSIRRSIYAHSALSDGSESYSAGGFGAGLKLTASFRSGYFAALRENCASVSSDLGSVSGWTSAFEIGRGF